MAKNKYDENQIQTLSALEHIRLRSGMYIGRLGNGSNQNDGIYVLFKEVIDNSIDEFNENCGNKIEITLNDKTVSVRDYGRGIPLGKVIECVSKINTGAKYTNEVFHRSVGLNGVGTKAVNALSSHFLVISYREGKFVSATFSQGKLIDTKKGTDKTQLDGTYVEFIPDEEIFKKYSYIEDFIDARLWNYAYLNPGLTLKYNGKNYKSARGLLDLLDKAVEGDEMYPLVHYRGEFLEFALTHIASNYGETYYSYVNGQHTQDGGTHLSAFKEGILKAVNEHFKKSWSSQDVREGIIGAISIKIENPVFESQTKNKLGNTEIRSWVVQEVKTGLIDYLLKNPEGADKLSAKITHNEKLRKELSDVRKNAKSSAKRVSLNIPKLKDCRYHLGQSSSHQDECENSVIFLTEGDSASGSITKTRDVHTQAVFSLRGKILNVYNKSKAEIYKNAELYNMMKALGIEDSLEGLRYGKVIIATDADNDGFHIRNLLMTYFLTYFEELVLAGRLYILETPLFRVRNKKQTAYCYNETDRDNLLAQIKGAEVTRFKGLGEIDPKEFGYFIGEEMKLEPVNISSLSSAQSAVKFYEGENTPTRRDFIMENLI
ncbi:MAG: type IIA DNA topoisomerase subunit B [Spirochaetaceae bacterium]|nr:type IIA DNA topoisomerase subunit B [Spirochaetaceae bacterium]